MTTYFHLLHIYQGVFQIKGIQAQHATLAIVLYCIVLYCIVSTSSERLKYWHFKIHKIYKHQFSFVILKVYDSRSGTNS